MGKLVFCTCLLLSVCQQIEMNVKDQVQRTRRAQRRYMRDFVEDKLIEQGQALEEILKMARKNEEMTQRLLEHLSMRLSPPRMPEKLHAPIAGRRNLEDQVALHPVEQFGINTIPRLGNLVKDWLVTQFKGDEPEPIALVEDVAS